MAALFVFLKWKVYKTIVHIWKEKRRQLMSCLCVGILWMMVSSICVQAKEEERITITPVNICTYANQIPYYDAGVEIKVIVEKDWLERGIIQVFAIPQDTIAKETAEQEENVYDYYEISHWDVIDETSTEMEEKKSIRFRFQLDGKWKIVFLCKINGDSENPEEIYRETTSEFVIDQEAPQCTVKYQSCQDISSICSSGNNVNRTIERNLQQITSSDCEVFAEERGEVRLTIRENYFSPEDVTVTVFEVDYASGEKRDVTKEFKSYEKNKDAWEQEGKVHTLQYQWEREGHFQFQVAYEDYAGHRLEAEEHEETACCIEEGIYKGPLYTIDNTAPVLKAFTYQRYAEKVWGKRSYFKERPVIVVEIREENFNRVDFMLRDIVTWADGSILYPDRSEDDYTMVWSYSYEKGQRINTALILIEEEGNHLISGWAADGSGHKSVIQTEACTYDSTAPEVEVRIWGEDYFIPYKTYQYFGREQITVSVIARDKISGVYEIDYAFDEKGKAENKKSHILYQDNNKDTEERGLVECKRELVFCEEKLKGMVCVQAENFTGTKSDRVVSPGILLASESVHQDNSSISLQVSEPDYTDEKRKIKYYKNPVVITAKAEDNFAGIGTFSLQVADGEREEKIDNRKKEDLRFEDTVTMRIQPSVFQKLQKKNWLEITASLCDNAGNQSIKEYTQYRIVMDHEKPEIAVDYNTNEARNGNYYNCTRTATVTVREKNFNPDAVRWEIAGSNQKYEIGPWTGEGDIHQCKINFAEDGKEYRIKVTVEDYAGNKAVWQDPNTFTIDKTPPVLTMEIDGKVENGIYYSRPQTLICHVKDKNIDRENSTVYFQNDEKTGHPVLLLQQEKNQYVAVRRYKKDGKYQVSFQCMDLAGNITKTETAREFIIDRTTPKVEITGVADAKTYTGKVQPCVTIQDKYLDRESIYVRLDRVEELAKDRKSWEYSVVYQKKKKKRWGRFIWNPLSYEEENDGIYRLQIYAKDMAGNSFSLDKDIVFQVNRFGSVYVFQENLQRILQKGYMKKAEDVVITEYSVNPVDTKITILKDNQNWRALYIESMVSPDTWRQKQRKTRDGKYAVLSERISTGSKKGWYVKRHYISAENFKEEGTYHLTLESSGYQIQEGKEKVVKETTSTLKGKPVYFTVDRTPPIVRIGGLEKQYYKEKTHPFVLTVMDNFGFSHMDVEIWCEGKAEPKQVFRILPEDLKKNHSVVKELSAYDGWQSIRYQAWDKAGNCVDSMEEGEQFGCVVSDREIEKEKIQEGKEKVKEYMTGEEKDQKTQERQMYWFAIGVTGLTVLAAAMVAVWKKAV